MLLVVVVTCVTAEVVVLCIVVVSALVVVVVVSEAVLVVSENFSVLSMLSTLVSETELDVSRTGSPLLFCEQAVAVSIASGSSMVIIFFVITVTPICTVLKTCVSLSQL